MDILVTIPDGVARADLDGAVVELTAAGDDPRIHFTGEVRVPAPHVLRNVTIRDLVLDPSYTPPWPGAGIKRVAPTDQP